MGYMSDKQAEIAESWEANNGNVAHTAADCGVTVRDVVDAVRMELDAREAEDAAADDRD